MALPAGNGRALHAVATGEYNTKGDRNMRIDCLGRSSTNSDIPEGLHVLHTCDNPLCINPDHLFLGTNEDNVRDRVQKGRSQKGPLTAEQVRAIRKDPRTLQVIGAEYGVHHSSIWNIKTGKTYTWVKDA